LAIGKAKTLPPIARMTLIGSLIIGVESCNSLRILVEAVIIYLTNHAQN
jgi:hypothetical protein